MDEFERRYRDDRRRVRTERIQQLSKRFGEIEEISIETKWKEVTALMKDDSLFRSVDRLDALIGWSEFVYGEDTLFRDRVRANTFRQMRKRRDAFRALLQKSVESGELHGKAKWSDWIANHHERTAYTDLLGLSGSCTPREMWEYCRDSLADAHETQKAAMKACMRTADPPVDEHVSFETFARRMATNREFASIPESKRCALFESVKAKLLKRGKRDAPRNASGSLRSPRLEPGEVDTQEDREEGQATSSDESSKSTSRKKHKSSKRDARGERRSRRRPKEKSRTRSEPRSPNKRSSRSPRRGHDDSHDSSGDDSDREKSKRRRR
eukprot:Polyplicarium_translucidae@DN3079_c0_g1_i3.p1